MKKISSILFILVLIISLNAVVYGDVISDIDKQLSDISAEKKAAASKLSGVDQELSTYVYDILSLDDKIELFGLSLKELQEKIEKVNTELNQQELALQNSAQSYNSAEEVYITRLRVVYENGIPSMLDILLSSQSISDFFSKINVLNSILEYDKSIVSNMQNQKEYIDYVKNNIEIQKVQLEQLKYDKEKSSAALEDTKAAKNRKVSELQSSKTSLKAKLISLTEEEEATYKKRAEELAKISYNTSKFNGVFAWPVPGYSYISAYYGLYDPWNTGKLITHTGLDIAGSGIYGKPIVAAEDGKVILVADYGDSSYGKCIVIDHGTSLLDGANYRTRYGHCSSIAVTNGQIVYKGKTVIGYVGSTGNSTGSHLHFEVIKNGKTVNPLPYVK